MKIGRLIKTTKHVVHFSKIDVFLYVTRPDEIGIILKKEKVLPFNKYVIYFFKRKRKISLFGDGITLIGK